nr:MAG TPA: hypothetical protein [Caudoviricetes sp.]
MACKALHGRIERFSVRSLSLPFDGRRRTRWSDCPKQSVPESDTGAYPQSQHRGRERYPE